MNIQPSNERTSTQENSLNSDEGRTLKYLSFSFTLTYTFYFPRSICHSFTLDNFLKQLNT